MHNIASAFGKNLLIVIKYGGNAMDAAMDDALIAEITDLREAGHRAIVVHGGGPEIDDALGRLGLLGPRLDGLRRTDAATMSVVEATLCATANKRLVRACLRGGVPAIGISGQDGGMVKARRASSPSGYDLGYVGEIVSIDPAPVFTLLQGGFTPIVSPVAIDEGAGFAYNVNADTVAGAIAVAVIADAFVTLTNVDRVLRDFADPTTGIDRFSIAEALQFAASEGCASSMKPKMHAAIDAANAGVAAAYICRARPGAISAALRGDATVVSA